MKDVGPHSPLLAPSAQGGGQGEGPKPEDELTVLVVTSAIAFHPDTGLLEAVLQSLHRHEPCLTGARTLIVCDAPRVRPDGKTNWKRGWVSESAAARYREYVARLREKAAAYEAPFHLAEIIVQERCRGFAMAVKDGLSHTKAPYVLVVQHDRAFSRPFGVKALLASFRQDVRIRYLGLSSSATQGHANLAVSRYRMDLGPLILQTKEPTPRPLVPLLFWYDSNHLASVAFYKEFVFGRTHRLGPGLAKRVRLKDGDFIEDKFGQAMLADIKAHGLAAHAKYGAYLLDEGEPYVVHCHGRLLGSSQGRTLGAYFGKAG